MKRFLCWTFGHRWEPREEIRYDQGVTLASTGKDELEMVNVTWVNDEACSRCGKESWWPA